MNRALRTFLSAESFIFFAGGLLGPLYAVFVQDIGGDVLTVGASWSVFMFLSGVGLLLSGRFIDRLRSEKPVIIASHALQAFGYLGYLFVTTPAHLFAVQMVLGISAAIGFPSRESWFTRFIDKDRIAFQWASWEASYSIAAAAASLIGAVVVSLYGFPVLFLSMFLVSIIGVAVMAFIPEGRK